MAIEDLPKSLRRLGSGVAEGEIEILDLHEELSAQAGLEGLTHEIVSRIYRAGEKHITSLMDEVRELQRAELDEASEQVRLQAEDGR